ncbi:nucleotidyltransferase domain-containing protein [Mangrovibrevibacter kandeliae]|uniref:nucleotidyltransferase domain-containing protein n=1 Tax=Mangrovibrevibacter kandeliae TaxID=2968473 RepID=UPI00211914F8|nr:nucleotidyltransferase domain-containing protein [Aurantimonas sp. CSK15Z-1]MCQ8782176.1 nucleotidyltransferase domain-containing protein [Aurantimonas sp. CSK15Z-1]
MRYESYERRAGGTMTTSLLDRVIETRTTERRRLAEARAAQILERAERQGLRISIIGSLGTPRFRLHSDVDLFVHGPIDTDKRMAVERLVADALRDTMLPYDIVYEGDLLPERAREFLDDRV